MPWDVVPKSRRTMRVVLLKIFIDGRTTQGPINFCRMCELPHEIAGPQTNFSLLKEPNTLRNTAAIPN